MSKPLSTKYLAVVYRAPKPLPGRGKGVTRRAAFNRFVTQKREAIRTVRRRTLKLGVGARGNVYANDEALLYQCTAVEYRDGRFPLRRGRVKLRTDEL